MPSSVTTTVLFFLGEKISLIIGELSKKIVETNFWVSISKILSLPSNPPIIRYFFSNKKDSEVTSESTGNNFSTFPDVRFQKIIFLSQLPEMR